MNEIITNVTQLLVNDNMKGAIALLDEQCPNPDEKTKASMLGAIDNYVFEHHEPLGWIGFSIN